MNSYAVVRNDIDRAWCAFYPVSPNDNILQDPSVTTRILTLRQSRQNFSMMDPLCCFL